MPKSAESLHFGERALIDLGGSLRLAFPGGGEGTALEAYTPQGTDIVSFTKRNSGC